MAASVSNRNLVASLSYLLWFITGIVILLTEKEDKFIRFHAMQSTILFGALFLVNTIIGIIFAPLAILGFVADVANALIFLVALVVWLVSMVKAYQGQVFKWPIVGDFAQKQVK